MRRTLLRSAWGAFAVTLAFALSSGAATAGSVTVIRGSEVSTRPGPLVVAEEAPTEVAPEAVHECDHKRKSRLPEEPAREIVVLIVPAGDTWEVPWQFVSTTQHGIRGHGGVSPLPRTSPSQDYGRSPAYGRSAAYGQSPAYGVWKTGR